MIWITRSDGGILIWQADQGLSMITDDSSTHGTYYVSVWVNVQSISADGICTLEPTTAAGAFLSWTIPSGVSGWQQFSGDHTFTYADPALYLVWSCFDSPVGVPQTIWIDDVFIGKYGD